MRFCTLLLLAAAALTAACGRDPERPSAEQDRELNGAAEMLDEAPEALANVDDSNVNAEAGRAD